MDYLKPDKIWSYLGVKSEEEFKDRYLLKGKFHSLVPEKIIKDYEVVERITFYSYFHYPLLDEAFSKSTRLFEASVTLKLENLGIKKNGFEPLHSKLKRLEKYTSQGLYDLWKQAKEIRNDFAHREAGVSIGIVLINAFKHNLNMINSLFLNLETIEEKENQFNVLLNQSEHFENGFFILEYQNKKILVRGAKPYTSGIFKLTGQSLWVFIPITGEKDIEKSSDLPKSFILRLENVIIDETCLLATCPTTTEQIKLIDTSKPENIEKFIQHDKRIELLEAKTSTVSLEYMAMLHHNILKEVSSFLYDDW